VREGFVVFRFEEIEGEKESNSLREREVRECHREHRKVGKIKSPSLLFLRKVGKKLKKL